MPPYEKNKSKAQQKRLFVLAREGEVPMEYALGRARASKGSDLPERVKKEAMQKTSSYTFGNTLMKIAAVAAAKAETDPRAKGELFKRIAKVYGVGVASQLAGAAVGAGIGYGIEGTPDAMALGAHGGVAVGTIPGIMYSGRQMKQLTANDPDRFAKRHPYLAGMLGPLSHAYVSATPKG
jgi:hypothetical protein